VPKIEQESVLKVFCIAAACCVFFVPALAFAKTYSCSFTVPTSAWAPTTVVIEHNPENDDILVFDEFVKEFVGKPVRGKIAAQSDQKIAFTWNVPAHDGRGNHATMVMRMAYFKATHKASVSSKIAGYVNQDSAFGTCKVK
jgi:hypothetical protein